MTGPTAQDVLTRVLECIDEVLIEEADIGPDTRLLDLPSVDSIAILDILTAAERATGLVLAPEMLHPDTFATPGTLAKTLAATAEVTP